MKNRISKFFSTYFGSALDLRVRIFMVLALAGVVASVFIGLVNLLSGAGIVAVLVDFAAAGLSAGLICFAQRTRNYRVCYLITIVVIFMGLFPYLFFRMGGYYGGTTLFLVFAVVYTVFLLEGRMAWVVTALELLLYAGSNTIPARPETRKVNCWTTATPSRTEVPGMCCSRTRRTPATICSGLTRIF